MRFEIIKQRIKSRKLDRANDLEQNPQFIDAVSHKKTPTPIDHIKALNKDSLDK